MAGRLNDMAHGKLEAPKLDPRQVVVRENFNYRDMASEAVKKHIAWLKQSIRDRGVEQPIRVEFVAGTVYLVDGQCRLEALKQLWDEGVEVYVPSIAVKGDEAEVLAKSMIANGSLAPTKLEFGQAAVRLLAYGWSKEKVSQYTPPHIAANPVRARRYVEEAVELHQAPLGVKSAIRDGVDGVEISPALALKVTRENRMMASEIVQEAAKEAKAKGKKVAKRPKGDGVKAREKHETANREEKLLKIGDTMAIAILAASESSGVDCDLALSWQGLRGQ